MINTKNMKGNYTSQNIEWSKNRAAISCKFSVKPPIIKQQKVANQL